MRYDIGGYYKHIKIVLTVKYNITFRREYMYNLHFVHAILS